MERPSQNLKTTLLLSLGRFHISEDYGFLLPNPLKKLPDHYRPWMEIADKLSHLIESHQLRAHVNKMPLLNCEFLKSHREQRLAHMILSFVTMGYVWQEGEIQPEQALVQGVNAILQASQDSLLQALEQLRLSIQDITRTLGQMHSVPADQIERQPQELSRAHAHVTNCLFLACSKVQILIVPPDYVDPDIFYAVIRIFLSGWKGNPAMPMGLIYEGVSSEPLKYSGGSAAQSTVLHAFDEFLGVRHSKESGDFLLSMREYMPPSHKAFLEELQAAPSLRHHVLSSGNGQLLTAYNWCVEALAELRSYHVTVVTKYLVTAAAKAKSKKPSRLPEPPRALEERGTGGTAVLSFLKSVRNKTLEAILPQRG